jgi:hypothetical protein
MEGAKTVPLSNMNFRLPGLIGREIRFGEDVQKNNSLPPAFQWDHPALEIRVGLGKEDIEWTRE